MKSKMPYAAFYKEITDVTQRTKNTRACGPDDHSRIYNVAARPSKGFKGTVTVS